MYQTKEHELILNAFKVEKLCRGKDQNIMFNVQFYDMLKIIVKLELRIPRAGWVMRISWGDNICQH